MFDRDQVLRDTLAQLPPDRLQRRVRATAEAHAMLRDTLGKLDEAGLRRVLELFNQDMNHGREVQGRFATGLVGRNANLLVASLANVNAIVPDLWGADDTWLSANLVSLRRGGRLPGGGWLFLSMVLHAREPQRFLPRSSTMSQGLAALEGAPVLDFRTGADYLEYCRRVHKLLESHGIAPHGADVLLFNASRFVHGSGAASVPLKEPEIPTISPPAVSGTATFLSTQVPTPAPIRPRIEVREAAPVTATGASFGWLHLTDFHQGMSSASWLWPNVRAKLLEDLERVYAQCGPWDLVFFTGDLTQRGAPEEFERLDRTLDQIWERLARLGSTPRLVAVPGNHDLARPRDSFDPVVLALQQWHENPRLRDHVLCGGDSQYLTTIRKAFAAYDTWAGRRGVSNASGAAGLLPGDVALSLDVGQVKVGVIGLNSAFLQLAEGDYFERLDVDPRQLHEICGHDAPEWLGRHHINLLLTHHPPAWLAARARQEFSGEIDTPGRFAAHFYGHMHEGTSTATSIGGAPTRLALQGASLFGLEDYERRDGGRSHRIHGYSAGRVELRGNMALMKIFPRRMIDNHLGRRVDRDQDNYHLDESGAIYHEAPLVKRPR